MYLFVIFDLIYFLFLSAISPLLILKSIKKKDFRIWLFQRLRICSPKVNLHFKRPVTWIHASSAGEVGLALKLVREKKKGENGSLFFITTNTSSGFRVLKNHHDEMNGNYCYAAFDFSFLIKNFVQKLNFDSLVLIEAELWPNMIHYAAQKAPVSIFNGRISDKHFPNYIKFKRIYAGILKKIHTIIPCDEISKNRYLALGVLEDKLNYFGHLKLEISPPNPVAELDELRARMNISIDKKVFVAGSIQPEETLSILTAIKRNPAHEMESYLIPRHLDKKQSFEKMIKGQFKVQVLSQEHWFIAELNTHLIFELGVLKLFYEIADLVFVGGSLCNRGGQNVIEAISYRKPVAVGSYTQNFTQVINLLKTVDGIKIVKSSLELGEWIREYLNDAISLKGKALNGYNLVKNESGSFKKAASFLL